MTVNPDARPELVPTEFLCRRKEHKSVTLSPLASLEQTYTWEMKPAANKQFRVGRVYEIPALVEDGNARVRMIPKFLRIHDDAALVAECESMEATRLVDDEYAKERLKAHDYNELAERLLPYRKLYATYTMNPPKRRVLELIVLDALRRPLRKEEL